MTTHDAINAVFEGGGALFLCLNVRRLLRDKSVKGVSLLTTSWWTAWGFWNVYFYSAVNTPASFWAGIAVVVVNAVWLGLAVYYARQAAQAAAAPGDLAEAHRLQRAVEAADARRKQAQAERERACPHTHAEADSFDGRPFCRDCFAGLK